jgi:Mrp family chromosome partitioning ATPase
MIHPWCVSEGRHGPRRTDRRALCTVSRHRRRPQAETLLFVGSLPWVRVVQGALLQLLLNDRLDPRQRARTVRNTIAAATCKREDAKGTVHAGHALPIADQGGLLVIVVINLYLTKTDARPLEKPGGSAVCPCVLQGVLLLPLR